MAGGDIRSPIGGNPSGGGCVHVGGHGVVDTRSIVWVAHQP